MSEWKYAASAVAFICAAILVFYGKSDWGWFIAGAILIGIG